MTYYLQLRSRFAPGVLTLASLTAKIINGRTYYYARDCQRVNGKPKIVRTIYLGSAHDLIAAATQHKAQQAPPPQAVDIAAFGDVVALYDLAQQIGLVELLDRHLPKRDQGLSVGHYLLLAAINRAVQPTSKSQFADWYRQTTLPRLLPAPADQLSSQAFWNHFDFVEEHHIEAAERELSQRLIEQFQLSLRTLTYDGTNFFTFIDTRTPAELPQRGHNKQKRNDLRQVSLGMLVSTDFHVPLFHKVYAGNVPDSTIFQTITEELRVRYRELARDCEHITLVFDKGNNSAEAFETLDQTDFHFIGSLVPSHHADLLDVPASRYQPLTGERLQDVRAYRTTRDVFGQERTIVVTHNDNLLHGQLQGLTTALEKARGKLRDLQTKLRRRREGRTRGGKAPTAASIRKQAQEALAGQHVKTVLRVEVEDGAVPTLTFETDQTALARLVDKQLGKTILFTDNDGWTNEEIVLGYRSQHHIEDAFRQMKHPHYLGWQPMFHWTDSKIRAHAFTCVLALTLSSLLQRTLYQKGLDLSLPRMFDLLGGIRETLVIYPKKPGQRHPSTARALSTLSAEQEQLVTALELRRYQ
jgi:transposase